MDLFKAHFIHPHTKMPFIIYFNQSDGHVTFVKDEEMIRMLLGLESQLVQDKQFLENIKKKSHLCDTQYPVSSFEEVYELLEQMGVDSEEISFKVKLVH